MTSQDRDHPPPRDGLTDAEVWEWTDDGWRVRTIALNEEANAGGNPAPHDDP